MIVTRQKFIEAMDRQRPNNVGMIQPTSDDATVIVTYARRLLPLVVQGEALFWEKDGQVDTPKMATLALALHQVEPEMFIFPDCHCARYLQIRDCTFMPNEPCGRRQWLDLVRERAAMPANIPTPLPPVPQRGRR